MKKHLNLLLLLLFGISLFNNAFVGIYLFLVCFPLLVAAKLSHLLGMGVIVFAAVKFLRRRPQDKAKEEG
jgi:predicted ABC-type exoprotein transport system permease subunit